MGVLYKTIAYLSGPMQFAEDGVSWRQMVTKELETMGIRVFDPYHKPFINKWCLEGIEDRKQLDEWFKEGKFDIIEQKMRAVRAADLACCDMATFGIFYFNPKIFTIGTAEELTNMNRAKRPCFVLWDSDDPCYWLYAMFSRKYQYRTWESLLGTIRSIDNGQIEPDSKRWKILREELR